MILLFRLLFWAALLFALVMALLPQPPQVPGEPSDKLLHILAFATLTALVLAAYPRLGWPWIALGLALVGGIIELAQMMPEIGREGSLVDWAADCGAVAVVLAIGVPLRRYLLRAR